MDIVVPDSRLQSVNGRIARHKNRIGLFALTDEVFPGDLRGGEVVLSDNTYGLAVELLGVGGADVVRAEAGLHVPTGICR
jgi:hypothetical protein